MGVQIKRKYCTNSLNLASEILERFMYLLLIVMTSFLALLVLLI